MLSDRTRRQIERLLDEAEAAMRQLDWSTVRQRVQAVLALDPNDPDARNYLAAAERADQSRAAVDALTPALSQGERGPQDTPATEANGIAPSPQPPAPTSFCDGRYEVKRFLGEGGKKRVFLAHDTKLDRDVAFSLIKTDGLDAEGLLRIRREAQAMGRLGDHPHIVSVHDIGEEAGQPYLVSQLMEGGDVESLIGAADGHRLSLDSALRIADQVCQALEHAHSHGIVHRDLKPGNVWLTADPSTGPGQAIAKLGDFGLAVALDRSRLTQAGMMVGTVHYMPPEQAMGGEVTARSDLYSLGAMLYEMTTGRPPFVGDESVAIITQHLNTPPVAPSWHVPDLPPGLEALILRLLEKDPAKRPGSAAEVRQLLAATTGSKAISPTPPQSPAPSPQPPGTSPIYHRTFVGRENELRQLRAAFDGALSGQSALVMVVGEPGIGKTALCEQLATHVAVRGGKTLVGHCYEEGSLSLPYLAFVEAMRTYVLDRDPEGLRTDLGSGVEDVSRIVSEIRQRLSLSQDSAPSTQHSPDPDEERWRLFQAVSGFLRNASAVQPLVIVLEDLHWADRGTLELLVHLARNLQAARLLVIGTYRDIEVDRTHPLSAALAELRRSSAFDRVLLRGLTAEEVQRMLATIAGRGVSWGFAEAVHRQTEGNPLFVQEVVRYLAEEGLIQRSEGQWQRVGGTPLEMAIPEGLRDVIGKRLSRLSPECNRVLAIAAVVGRDFELETLRTVAAVGEEDLLSAIEEAIRVGVLDEQSRPGSIRYRFAHAFFRQTLYEEMIAPRRLRLHQEVGRAIEALYGRRIEEHAAEVAEHFGQSTDPADLAKAIRYGEMAGRRAVAVHAYGEAVRHFERALQVLEVLDPDDRERRCDLLLALGEALLPAGEPRRFVDIEAEAALALAEALGDNQRAARTCRLALDALYRLAGGQSQVSPLHRQWARRLLSFAVPGTPERVWAEMQRWGDAWSAGRWAEAWTCKEQALAMARALGDSEALFFAVGNFMSPGFSSTRHADKQLELADEFMARPHDGVRVGTLATLLGECEWTYVRAGQPDSAEAARREQAELAARAHDPIVSLWPMLREIADATFGGRLPDAIEGAATFATRTEELGSPVRGRFFAEVLSYWPLVYLGRWEEALDTLGGAARMVQLAGTTVRAGRRSLCLAGMGRRDEAREDFRQLWQRLNLSEQEDEMFSNILADLLASAVVLEEQDAVRLLVGRLDGVTAVAYGNGGIILTARWLGAAHVLLGDREQARADYERALAWATTVGHRPEIALTRLGLAELLLEEAISSQPSAVSSQPIAVTSGADDGGTAEKLFAETLKAEGLAHLNFAIEELRAMNMQPALERALRHKGLLHA